MSEIINNREYRQKVLKGLIKELHEGKDFEEVKRKFQEVFEGVAAKEISDLEASLIAEGMPVEEIQRLCDVHASIFKGSIEEIHKADHEGIKPEDVPGHPVHTFRLENRELEKLINESLKPNLQAYKVTASTDNKNKLMANLNELLDIDKHYSRKENLLFPYLEKYGVTAPPKVMWGVDDEIRAAIKEAKLKLQSAAEDASTIIEEAINKVVEMIFKEENILFPMSLDTLTEDEWFSIAEESDGIGFCLTQPSGKWKPSRAAVGQKAAAFEQQSNGSIKFETGVLTVKEINGILNNIPVDITFIDKDNVVKYFTLGKERIFARTKAIIGRNVSNCHPPASVHIVEEMVEDFKSGRKDHEDFWIKMGQMVVYIRYFAVRDEQGEYIGTMEVTQNIAPIKAIEGEKRLVE
ncbi:MAG: PAS domain S-box protein [Clostridiales bacterium GWB2_37_7]|nr:MAG: PAS domain S-box protein [Clostridiales bacterium GWB2_37_7]